MATGELRALLNKVGDGAVAAIAASDALKEKVEQWQESASALDEAMYDLTRLAERREELEEEIKVLEAKRNELAAPLAHLETLLSGIKK